MRGYTCITSLIDDWLFHSSTNFWPESEQTHWWLNSFSTKCLLFQKCFTDTKTLQKAKIMSRAEGHIVSLIDWLSDWSGRWMWIFDPELDNVVFTSFQGATYPRTGFAARFAGAQPATVFCVLAPPVPQGALASEQRWSQATDEVRRPFLLLLLLLLTVQPLRCV